MIYLDSAAIVKLINPEPESAELDAWLIERVNVTRVTSDLAEVEVPRAIIRVAPDRQPKVSMVMSSIMRIGISAPVRTLAASYKNPMLRSLDAIHLATAQILVNQAGKPLATLVTYDKRLLMAAKEAGIPVASPGVTT